MIAGNWPIRDPPLPSTCYCLGSLGERSCESYSLCSLRLIPFGDFMSLSGLLEGVFPFEKNYYRTQGILNPGKLTMTIIYHRSLQK